MAVMAYCLKCKGSYSLKKGVPEKCECGGKLKFRTINKGLPGSSFESLNDARLHDAEQKRAMKRGQEIPGVTSRRIKVSSKVTSAPTLEEGYKRLLRHFEQDRRGPKYLKDCWGRLLNGKPELATRPMDAIKTTDIDDAVAGYRKYFSKHQKKGEQPAPQTIKNFLARLSRIYTYMKEKGLYLGLNPVDGADKPNFDNTRVRWLNEEQTNRLIQVLEEMDNQYAGRLLLFLLYTGRRLGEVCALKWANVNHEQRLIQFPGEIVKIGELQGAPLPDVAWAVLVASQAQAKGQLVFPQRDGTSYYTGLFSMFRRARVKAGIPDDFTIHDLRHNFICQLANSGQVDITTAGKLVGHKSLRMTMERYHSFFDKTLRAGAEAANEIFKKKG